MKKVLTLIMFAVCGLQLFGCAPTLVKSNTIKSASIKARVETAPVVADIRVEKKRVTGQAAGKIGKYVKQADIEAQAIANALGQNPPSANGPDLLIGANGFSEWKGKKRLTYTVTGYPGYYTNFRPAEDWDSAWLTVLRPGLLGYAGQGVPRQSVSHDTVKVRQMSDGWRRGGTIPLNLLVPGLGSILIMDDWNGAYVQWGLVGGGFLVLAIDGFSGYHTDDSADAASIIGTIAIIGGQLVWNIYRSLTYPLPEPQHASSMADNTGLKWAVMPAKDGGVKGYLAYSAKF